MSFLFNEVDADLRLEIIDAIGERLSMRTLQRLHLTNFNYGMTECTFFFVTSLNRWRNT